MPRLRAALPRLRPGRSRPHRLLTTAALAAGLLALTSCSTGPTDDRRATSTSTVGAEPGAYPVTLEHAFGSTTVERQPKRVATLGWSDQDIVLALGIAPVGATKITWGGNASGSTPWFDTALERIGGTAPERYDDADGVPFDRLAALRPDLILATSSGLTAGQYRKLSRIAPTVAYPEAPWQTPWRDSVHLVGQALGLPAAADRLVAETERSIARARAAHPVLAGKTFIFASLTPTDLSKIDYYTPADNRPLMLTELGMRNAPVVERLARGNASFFGTVSAERAGDLEADVFITYQEGSSDLAKFAKDPLLGQIPAFRTGAVLGSQDKTASLGLSSPTPLSIPWAMDHFVPELAAAAAEADG